VIRGLISDSSEGALRLIVLRHFLPQPGGILLERRRRAVFGETFTAPLFLASLSLPVGTADPTQPIASNFPESTAIRPFVPDVLPSPPLCLGVGMVGAVEADQGPRRLKGRATRESASPANRQGRPPHERTFLLRMAAATSGTTPSIWQTPADDGPRETPATSHPLAFEPIADQLECLPSAADDTDQIEPRDVVCPRAILLPIHGTSIMSYLVVGLCHGTSDLGLHAVGMASGSTARCYAPVRARLRPGMGVYMHQMALVEKLRSRSFPPPHVDQGDAVSRSSGPSYSGPMRLSATTALGDLEMARRTAPAGGASRSSPR